MTLPNWIRCRKWSEKEREDEFVVENVQKGIKFILL
jgi:hypothetical protein